MSITNALKQSLCSMYVFTDKCSGLRTKIYSCFSLSEDNKYMYFKTKQTGEPSWVTKWVL